MIVEEWGENTGTIMTGQWREYPLRIVAGED
jgi:hypothetical protein